MTQRREFHYKKSIPLTQTEVEAEAEVEVEA